MIFAACSLMKVQNFFIESFPRYKVCLFSLLSKAHVVEVEYLQGICSSTFGVEDFSRLFVHPSIFSVRDSRSA